MYVIRVDPRGWMPNWLTNLVAGDQTLNVARARDHFARIRAAETAAAAAAPGQ